MNIQDESVKLIEDLENDQGAPCAWRHAPPRCDYAALLRKRLSDGKAQPTMNQGNDSYLCGTAFVAQAQLLRRPSDFFRFAIQLYRDGKSTINGRETIALDALKALNPFESQDEKTRFKGDWVDFIVLASLRGQLPDLPGASWFRAYLPRMSKPIHDTKSGNVAKVSTTPADVKAMLNALGFTIASAETLSDLRVSGMSVHSLHGREKNLQNAIGQKQKGNCVGLFVNSFVTRKFGNPQPPGGRPDKEKDTFSMPTHWIYLDSHVFLTNDNISFVYIDYGQSRTIRCPKKEFLLYYYGYIAAY